MPQLTAYQHYSGFPLAHDTYNALSVAGDGKVYYVLSSEDIKVGGHMFVFDPKEKTSHLIGDLTTFCGENGNKTIGQGKSHVNVYFLGRMNIGDQDIQDLAWVENPVNSYAI